MEMIMLPMQMSQKYPFKKTYCNHWGGQETPGEKLEKNNDKRMVDGRLTYTRALKLKQIN